MERLEAIERIKKLMAVAKDKSVTDNEVLTAIAMADKLRIRFKIEENELLSSEHDLDSVQLNGSFYGYIIYPLEVLSNHFRCEMARKGRLNSNDVKLYVFGHKEDIEFCIPMLEYLIVYL